MRCVAKQYCFLSCTVMRSDLAEVMPRPISFVLGGCPLSGSTTNITHQVGSAAQCPPLGAAEGEIATRAKQEVRGQV